MTDWIDQKATQIKKNQQEAAKEHDQRLHAQQVIRARGRDVLPQLEEIVRADVEEWNSHFRDDKSRTIDTVSKSLPSGFRVHKSHFPSATVDVDFDPDSLSLRVRITRRDMIRGEPSSTDEQIHVDVAADETISLTPHTSGKCISFADASRLILEAIIDQDSNF
jgi:hypothetical protein